MRGCAGCLIKPFPCLFFAAVFVYGVLLVLNPWALHISGRFTPLLYRHGTGTVQQSAGPAS